MAKVKQNITIAVDKSLLKQARALAAQRGTSISGLLGAELERIVAREAVYERAKAKALAFLDSPFHLGGARMSNREELHDRQGLR